MSRSGDRPLIRALILSVTSAAVQTEMAAPAHGPPYGLGGSPYGLGGSPYGLTARRTD